CPSFVSALARLEPSHTVPTRGWYVRLVAQRDPDVALRHTGIQCLTCCPPERAEDEVVHERVRAAGELVVDRAEELAASHGEGAPGRQCSDSSGSTSATRSSGTTSGKGLRPSRTEMRSPTSRMIVEMGTSSASATEARISLDASF